MRINKIKVFNNREGFPGLFPDQRPVHNSVNDNDASVRNIKQATHCQAITIFLIPVFQISAFRNGL
jgi:hypothetical protein